MEKEREKELVSEREKEKERADKYQFLFFIISGCFVTFIVALIIIGVVKGVKKNRVQLNPNDIYNSLGPNNEIHAIVPSEKQSEND